MIIKSIISITMIATLLTHYIQVFNSNDTNYQTELKTAYMGELRGKNEALYINDSVNPFEDICNEYGINPLLVKAIGIKETGLDYAAVGDQGRSKGAYQIQDAIWSKVYGDLDLFDEYEATRACCEVLTYLYNNYGSTIRVLNAYNTGNPDCLNGYSEDVLCIMEDLENGKY